MTPDFSHLLGGLARWPLTRKEAERSARTAGRLEASEHRCNHEWLYKEREPGETYTGYCEWCPLCGVIRQIPQ
jgi:hypothetical protein